MPTLPLDHPEPFSAVLGVMLYPGTNDGDPVKARAFALHWLATPIQRCEQAGHKIPREILLRLATDGGQRLDDLDQRCTGGRTTGELFIILWALFNTDPRLATWNNAIKIAEQLAGRTSSGSRSLLWAVRSRFLAVAHLWAAWVIRKFDAPLERGYLDFQSFLAEAEIFRDFGRTWLPERAKSKPLLASDAWRVPENWKRENSHSVTARIPVIMLPEDLLSTLRRAGRPRKGC